MLEESEDCDDGNSDDADGCNADCEQSGTAVWTVDTEAKRVAVGPTGNIHTASLVFTSEGFELDLETYASDGQLIERQGFGLTTPIGTSMEFSLGDLIVQAQDDVVYSVLVSKTFSVGTEFIHFTGSSGGWFEEQADLRAMHMANLPEGRIAVAGREVSVAWHAWVRAADGQTESTFEVDHEIDDLATVGHDLVLIGDGTMNRREADGTLVWTVELPEGARFVTSAGGDLVVAGSADGDAAWLGRWTGSGTELFVVEQATSDATWLRSPWALSGNDTGALALLTSVYATKLTPDLVATWDHPLSTAAGPEDLAVGPEGRVYILTGQSLVALAR